MRNICGSMFLAGTLVVIGCGKEQDSTATTPPPVSAPKAAAPAPETPVAGALGQRDGYLGTIVKAQQSAVKSIDTSSLNQEVTLFQAQEGRYPKDLNELVTAHYIGKLPETPVGMKLNYDPTNGKVTVVAQ